MSAAAPLASPLPLRRVRIKKRPSRRSLGSSGLDPNLSPIIVPPLLGLESRFGPAVDRFEAERNHLRVPDRLHLRMGAGECGLEVSPVEGLEDLPRVAATDRLS
jgi:hypothetical protein